MNFRTTLWIAAAGGGCLCTAWLYHSQGRAPEAPWSLPIRHSEPATSGSSPGGVPAGSESSLEFLRRIPKEDAQDEDALSPDAEGEEFQKPSLAAPGGGPPSKPSFPARAPFSRDRPLETDSPARGGMAGVLSASSMGASRGPAAAPRGGQEQTSSVSPTPAETRPAPAPFARASSRAFPRPISSGAATEALRPPAAPVASRSWTLPAPSIGLDAATPAAASPGIQFAAPVRAPAAGSAASQTSASGGTLGGASSGGSAASEGSLTEEPGDAFEGPPGPGGAAPATGQVLRVGFRDPAGNQRRARVDTGTKVMEITCIKKTEQGPCADGWKEAHDPRLIHTVWEALVKKYDKDKVPVTQMAMYHWIAYLYKVLLDREPTQQEHERWSRRREDGMAIAEVYRAFFSLKEYRGKKVSDRQFVLDAYQAVLFRKPSEEVLQWLVHALKTHDMPRGKLIEELLSRKEFQYEILPHLPGAKAEPRVYQAKDEPKIPEHHAQECRIREEILKRAGENLGIPYVYGGNNPRTGMDCSAWMSYIWWGTTNRRHVTDNWAEPKNAYSVSKKDLKPGDVLNMTDAESRTGTGHIMLFAGWAKDGVWVYDESAGVGRSSKRKVSFDYIGTYRAMRRYDLPRPGRDSEDCKL